MDANEESTACFSRNVPGRWCKRLRSFLLTLMAAGAVGYLVLITTLILPYPAKIRPLSPAETPKGASLREAVLLEFLPKEPDAGIWFIGFVSQEPEPGQDVVAASDPPAELLHRLSSQGWRVRGISATRCFAFSGEITDPWGRFNCQIIRVQIVRWYSDTEAEVRCAIERGPLSGCGWTIRARFEDGKWKLRVDLSDMIS